MSEAIAFDTHQFVKNLTESGFTEKQAEALAKEQVQLLNSNLATKVDLQAVKAELEAKIESVKADLQAVKAELEAKIESVKADLQAVKAELEAKIEAAKFDLLKWMVLAMIAQGGVIVALVKML